MVATIGIAILLVSILGGWLLVRRPVAGRQMPPVLLFFLYFWLIAFALLLLVSLGYWLSSRV